MHTSSVRIVAWHPARSYIDAQQLLRRRSKVAAARAAQPTARRPTGTRRARRGRRWPAPRQQRHERRARRLMPAIPHRLAQPVVLAVLQRVHERQHALQVEDRVPPRQRLRQAPPAPSPWPDRPPASPRPAADPPATSSAARSGRLPSTLDHRRQPAEQRRRRVVGVSFDRGRRRQQHAVGQRLASRARRRGDRPPLRPRCCPDRPPSGCRSSTSTNTVGVAQPGAPRDRRRTRARRALLPVHRRRAPRRPPAWRRRRRERRRSRARRYS